MVSLESIHCPGKVWSFLFLHRPSLNLKVLAQVFFSSKIAALSRWVYMDGAYKLSRQLLHVAGFDGLLIMDNYNDSSRHVLDDRQLSAFKLRSCNMRDLLLKLMWSSRAREVSIQEDLQCESHVAAFSQAMALLHSRLLQCIWLEGGRTKGCVV